MEEDTLNLGGIIELSGFKNLDRATMTIVKKIVGNYARKLSDSIQGFEKVSINLKQVHGESQTEKGSFEINAKVIIEGNPVMASVSSHNLFIGLDEALKKVEKQIMKD